MNIYVIVIVAISIVSLFLMIYLITENKKLKSYKSDKEEAKRESALKLASDDVDNFKQGQDESIASNFKVMDSSGNNIITAHEIYKLPTNSVDITNDSAMNGWATHFLTDATKAGMSIPNRTIELAFKADIQKGLDAGKYTIMTTKTNERLADVIDVNTKKIVGKGRIVEGGRVKQFAAGAFHIASIAVAQSHLADISKNLKAINSSLGDISKHLEVLDTGKIKGAISYYEQVAALIEKNNNPDSLGSSIKVNIEANIKDSHVWVSSVFDKFKYLISQIEGLDDADNFGTSSTYADFKKRVKQVESIGRDYDLLMKFNNMSIAILGYLDPQNTEYTRMDIKEADWKVLVEKYVVACRNKSIQYFQDKGSLFNSSETLETRSENINNTATLISHSLLSDLNLMAQQKEAIEQHLEIFKQDEMRMSIKFNNEGNIEKSVLLK
ncbi:MULTISPECIES: hypothetical protein [unclassified Pseudoalteromonas]|uniref:hypothetical protein n=1 Tax=unclassified Pseudoalteromonas TaxID=194690 RepID=UPI002358639C|nr:MULTISPECIES: hypothetical protein [unclassified Pseudoalteromonas]MDC9500698.1 hypothetical protein [Pseudoalteromonas sp. Angola-18]MDC9529309.1 hypothetical protein [Pseudoalteromonas sp. Angola-7]